MLYAVLNIIAAILFILVFFIFINHIFRDYNIIKTNIKHWQGSLYEWISLASVIVDRHSSNRSTSLWDQQRALIYKFIKNEKAIWILNSFLAFEVVKLELEEVQWKNLILRGAIYFIAYQFYYAVAIFYSLFCAMMTITAAKELFEDLVYSYQTRFDFQSLPFPLQQRFYELQPPVTRYRFSKAYFTMPLKTTYNNKICVDNFYIRRTEEECHMLYEYFDTEQAVQSSLTLGCNAGESCGCSEEMLSNISVVKAIHAFFIASGDLSDQLLKINFLNVKYLEMYESALSFADLRIISTMNLKFITLHICDDGIVAMRDIMQAVIGVPHLRIWFKGECHDPDEFAVYLVEWILENGYIESLDCKGYFLGETFEFKSSNELSITDIFDSL